MIVNLENNVKRYFFHFYGLDIIIKTISELTKELND